MNEFYRGFLKILKKYFEPVSIGYHMTFFTFLMWATYIKPKEQKVNPIFLRALGIYVICYGLVFLFYSPGIMNHSKLFKNL